jgi:hypothetical protein
MLDYINTAQWDEPLGLEDMAKFDYSPMAALEDCRMGFHYPYTVRLHGRDIPAYSIQHHAAHAASTYYPSGFRSAAVLTHDGAFYKTGPNNGLIFRGDEHRLFPLTPHHLHIGDLYDQISGWLGFDLFGAAGKLMGLAPYGNPRFFDRRFVGNTHDLAKRGINQPAQNWWDHCVAAARDMRYDVSPLRDVNRILEPVCVDIAASTQKLFEETILLAAECTAQLFRTMKRPMENLCYAGGTGLSCPTNTRLYNEGPFRNLYIPPDCDDSGLSMGAALYLYHNILDNPLNEGTAFLGTYPYLGGTFEGAATEAALAAVADQIDVARPDDWAVAAAEDIAADRVIAGARASLDARQSRQGCKLGTGQRHQAPRKVAALCPGGLGRRSFSMVQGSAGSFAAYAVYGPSHDARPAGHYPRGRLIAHTDRIAGGWRFLPAAQAPQDCYRIWGGLEHIVQWPRRADYGTARGGLNLPADDGNGRAVHGWLSDYPAEINATSPVRLCASV